jgi:hypothetical protein
LRDREVVERLRDRGVVERLREAYLALRGVVE